MAKLVISINGMNMQEYELTGERVTLGRGSGNDIVLNEPVVSGEHAVLKLADEAIIVDLDSTNGTYLNGQAVRNSPLRHNDVVVIGNHELRYVDESVQDFASTMVLKSDSPETTHQQAALKLLNGPRAGEMMPITKQRTALGKPGVQVAVIVQQGGDYLLQPVITDNRFTMRINNEPVGGEGRQLHFGDEIVIADARLTFISQPGGTQ